MKKLIAILLSCAMLTGIIPASLPETVHAAAVSAAEQEKWYEATAKINSSWGGHIAGEITLTNNSKETIQDWQIEFPWDAQITSIWCGNYQPTENGYIITPADYNRNLAAGASVSIGFMAEGEDSILENSSQNISSRTIRYISQRQKSGKICRRSPAESQCRHQA